MVSKENKVQSSTNIYPLLVVLICALLGYWVISPKIAEIKEFNTSIAAKEQDTASLNEKIQNLKTLQKQFEAAPGDVEILNLAIADDPQMPEIIEQLTSMASKSGMTIKSIRPDYRDSTNETVVGVTLRGDYINLINYISETEKNLRPASVKSINLSSTTLQDQSVLDTTLAIGFFTAKSNSDSVAKALDKTNQDAQ
ncbi:MAG: hypothetical protein ACD_58C00059G0002 [uncultured bacterium]|nr:MAG: hypothetical protein ACD_58C00059G0002 [uncultured bacterium]